MKTKIKQRFTIVPVEGPILAGVPANRVLDNSTNPPAKLKSGQSIKIAGLTDRVGNVYNEYYAERECQRLNMLNEPDRRAHAISLKKLIGRRFNIHTFGIGWNRRTGGNNAVLCLLSAGTKVQNVSSAVSTVLGWKWKDNDSVDAGSESNLVRVLSYMLYGDENKLKCSKL